MGIEYEFNLNFEGLDANVEAAIPTALGRAMEHVLGVVTPKVPEESGQLIGSADIKIEGHTASITYPGPYARYQHFGMDLRHDGPKSRNPNAEPLFLERPMASEAKKVLDMLGTDVGRAL